jgi:hypothetical protein
MSLLEEWSPLDDEMSRAVMRMTDDPPHGEWVGLMAPAG